MPCIGRAIGFLYGGWLPRLGLFSNICSEWPRLGISDTSVALDFHRPMCRSRDWCACRAAPLRMCVCVCHAREDGLVSGSGTWAVRRAQVVAPQPLRPREGAPPRGSRRARMGCSSAKTAAEGVLEPLPGPRWATPRAEAFEADRPTLKELGTAAEGLPWAAPRLEKASARTYLGSVQLLGGAAKGGFVCEASSGQVPAGR